MTNSKLKVVVLGTRGFPDVQGGVETHCEHLYPLLVKLGCEVTVFSRQPYVGKGEVDYKGVKIVPLFCPKRKAFEAIVHTFYGILAARKLKPDVLHIHAIGPALLVPFARLFGLRVVMTNHGPDYDRQKWGFFAKVILRMGQFFGSVFSNEVISISEPISDLIKKNTGRKRINIIPNGVVFPEPVTTSDSLERFGLEKGRYIVAVGRFVPEKGFHDLIEAFSKLRASAQTPNSQLKTQNYKLVIVGDSDHEDAYSKGLKDLAKKTDGVVLTGFIKGKVLQEIYAHAKLFVLPSYHEGLPIVLLEALSYGLSCIASNIPANRNIDLGDDRFFTPGNINQLSEKLHTFLNKNFTAADRKKQIAMIQKDYNWNYIAAEILKVYKNL